MSSTISSRRSTAPLVGYLHEEQSFVKTLPGELRQHRLLTWSRVGRSNQLRAALIPSTTKLPQRALVSLESIVGVISRACQELKHRSIYKLIRVLIVFTVILHQDHNTAELLFTKTRLAQVAHPRTRRCSTNFSLHLSPFLPAHRSCHYFTIGTAE